MKDFVLTPMVAFHVQQVVENAMNFEVWRPSTVDLILTKMMRVGPEDRADIRFLIRQNDFDANEMFKAFRDAAIPSVPEIQDAFLKNRQWLTKLLKTKPD